MNSQMRLMVRMAITLMDSFKTIGEKKKECKISFAWHKKNHNFFSFPNRFGQQQQQQSPNDFGQFYPGGGSQFGGFGGGYPQQLGGFGGYGQQFPFQGGSEFDFCLLKKVFKLNLFRFRSRIWKFTS